MGTLNALCYFDGYLCDFNGFDRTIRIPWEKYVFYMGIITVIWNCGGQLAKVYMPPLGQQKLPDLVTQN